LDHEREKSSVERKYSEEESHMKQKCQVSELHFSAFRNYFIHFETADLILVCGTGN